MALWNAKPENRRFPSALEWANIRALSKKRDWTEAERRMMARAGQFHGLRVLGLAAAAALLAAVGLSIRNRVVEGNQATAARGLVRQIISRHGKGPGDHSGHQTARPPLDRSRAEEDRCGRAGKLKGEAPCRPRPDPRRARPGRIPLQSPLKATPGELPVIRKASMVIRQSWWIDFGRSWKTLKRARTSASVRRAALAGYEPGAAEERWLSASGFITKTLLDSVKNNPSDYAQLLETLRPIRQQLLASLSATFRAEQRPGTERSVATNILADFAGDQPAVLADLLMDAGDKAYPVLFPAVQGREAETVPLFQAEIGKKASYEWNDPPRERSWAELDRAAKSRIESAGGLVAERFAFCQTMPLAEFLTTAEGLRSSGYRPIRFRPYADGQVARVAAVWKRDGRKWKIAHDQAADQIGKQDELNRKEGFVPVDVAGYVATGADGKPADRYASVWAEKAGTDDDARMVTSLAASEVEKAARRFQGHADGASGA